MNIRESFSKLENPKDFKFEWVNCYSCGSEEAKLLLVGQEDLTGKEGNFQYVECSECGLAYQNPRVHSDDIKSFYDSEYIAHRKKKNWGFLTPLYERAMNKHDRDKEKLVREFIDINSKSKVIDIGCAVGTFLLHLKDKTGCSISGVDFKDDLEFPRFDEIDFHCGLLYEQDNLIDDSYDAVTMWHFLEHCYDPTASLKKASKIIKKSGRIIIEVPRLDSLTYRWFGSKWPGVQAPQHTVMFDKEHFIKMIEDNGLKVTKYLPYGAFPSYFYIFAGAYFKIIGKGLNLDKIIVPYFLGQLLLSPLLWFEKKLNLSMQTIICERVD
jgi:2-polyprenyl-3-methyl-5-hydroxy-6-metoxy-1,4-benzoquinol methylase